MPYDGARWQIDIMAADKTAAAFASADRRLRGFRAAQAQASAAISAGYGALARALTPLVAAISAAAVAHKIWAAGMNAANLGEQAEQLGINTDQLQAYRFVAAQVGVENAQLDASLMRLVKAMGTAGEGNDEMIARFERLGVKLLDVEGKMRKPADVLPELARGLIGVRSETERNALMMEFMGRSGSRMVTMLETWAQGNDRVVESARSQGGIIGAEAIAKWDKLGDAVARAGASSSVLLATLSSSSAERASSLMEQLARNTERATVALQALPKDAGFMEKLDAIFGGRTGNNTMGGLRLSTAAELASDKLANDRTALNKLLAAREGTSGATAAMLDEKIRRQTDLVQKQEAAYRALAKAEENAAAMQRLVNDGLPVIDNPKSGGFGQPRGDGSRKAGEKDAAAQLRESQKQMDELHAAIEKIRQASEGVMDRFGDGAAYAARETAELDEMLTMGFFGDPGSALALGVHARALQDITAKADDMARAYRGAVGGADAFIAGIQQGMADLERTNTAFEVGKQLVDQMADSIADLATGAQVDFNRIAQSFLTMIVQMELRAAASNIFNMARGKGPTDQGLISSLIGGLGGLFGGGAWDIGPVGTGYNGGGSLSYGGPRAAGGSVNPGSWYMVGEKGPEPFVPHTAGTIIPNGAMGGVPAIVNIYSSGDNQVRREQRTGSDGQSITDIFITAIENKLARNLDNGTGAQAKVLQGRYGIAPVGRR